MQFRLSTLLWLFVVLWSSMAMVSALSDDPYLPVWIGTLAVWMFGGVTLYYGLAAARRWIASLIRRPRQPAVAFDPLPPLFLWLVAVGCVTYLLAVGCTDPRVLARRAASANNLKSLGAALHDYAQDHGGCLPPAYAADKNGKSMHGWRTQILPYVHDGSARLPKYSFSEAWNGPKNSKVLNQAPRPYIAPEDWQPTPMTSPNNAGYVAVLGPNAAWRGDRSVKLGAIRNQLDKTVLLIEVADSGIVWTEPRDVSWNDAPKLLDASPRAISLRKRRAPSGFFFQASPESVLVLLANGSIGQLSGAQLTPDGLKAALIVGGYAANDSGMSGRRLNWPNCCTLLVWTGSIYVLLRRLVCNFPLTIKGQGRGPLANLDNHR
jgi:hypothetical protein